MPSTCEFQLNSPNCLYYSGQVVSGSVTLNTTSEKNIRSIRIRFLGEANVEWTESERHRKSNGDYENRTVHYTANEVYVDNATTVHGEGVLAPGTYTYNFNIPLPISCPTSCEGGYGHIRYALWLTVDRPMRTDNEFSQPLIVMRTVDLNLNPAFTVPIQCEEISSVGCWPCASGEISYILTVPFGAYVPGQTLKYTLLIQNQSMTDISGYNVGFNEYMTFISHTPRHDEREEYKELVNKEYSDSCLRLSNRQFEGELLLPNMLTGTEDHGIIRIRHSLSLEINVDGCHSNKTIRIPMFIGNVPIGTTDNNFLGMTPSAPLLLPSAPDGNNGTDLPPSYGNFKPPSFDQIENSKPPSYDSGFSHQNNAIGFTFPTEAQTKEKQ